MIRRPCRSPADHGGGGSRRSGRALRRPRPRRPILQLDTPRAGAVAAYRRFGAGSAVTMYAEAAYSDPPARALARAGSLDTAPGRCALGWRSRRGAP
jgi:hypothetical protein